MRRRSELKDKRLRNNLSNDDQILVDQAKAVFQKYIHYVQELEDS